MCVYVGGLVVKGKTCPFTHSPLTVSSRNIEFYWHDCIFLSSEVFEIQLFRPGKPNGSHSHVLFLLERKSERLMLFFRKHHQRNTHEVKMSLTIFF